MDSVAELMENQIGCMGIENLESSIFLFDLT